MHRIGLILPQDFQLLNLAPLTVFEIAETTPDPPHYDLHLLSEYGGSLGPRVAWRSKREAFGDPAFDTIIMGAITSFVAPDPSPPKLIAFIREAAHASRLHRFIPQWCVCSC